MELINGNSGSNDTDDDSSPILSPIMSRKIVLSPPIPPRKASPTPKSNSHTRNERHLTVPKENAPPPPAVILACNKNYQNNEGTNHCNFLNKYYIFNFINYFQVHWKPGMTYCTEHLLHQ